MAVVGAALTSAVRAADADAAWLVNISTRVQLGGTAGTPIAGFVLAGAGSRPMLVRAVGPGLAALGLTSGALADPNLALMAGNSVVGRNDNWLAADAPTMAAAGAFGLSAGSRDAALLATLSPGGYTMPVTAPGSGIALLEVYDAATAAATTTFVNASTRGFVGTGDSVLIAGFVVDGPGALRLLLRGIGPTLSALQVPGPLLADPVLTLFRGTTVLATNDNWAAADAATMTAVGAFALPAGSRDAALLAALPAGAYTAVLSGAGNTSGTGMVELYVVPGGSPALAEGEWGLRAELPEANSEMSVAELGGKIYVVGGYPSNRISVATVQVYDSATDSWTLTTPLPVALNHTVSAGVNGKLYVIGGQTSAGGTGPFVNTVYEFDPAKATWTTRTPMPTARGGGGGAVVDGKIYLAGGRPPRGSDFAVYDPAADTWKTLPDLPTQRNHIGVAAVGGKIYVVGGRFEAGFESAMTDRVEMFDPVTGSWSVRASLPRPRGGVNAIAAHGLLHVFGGEGNTEAPSGVFPDHDVYNPSTNTWTRMAPMPIPVHGVTGAALIDGVIHLPGGGTSLGGSSGSTIHQVYRPVVPTSSSVVASGAALTRLASGLHFTEGPVADAAGNVFFSDLTGNTIYRWSVAAQLAVFRPNSGGANGLGFDRSGNLLACEGGNGRIVSIDPQGSVTVLTATYGGQRYNEPNDLWIDPAGGVYFTDPVFLGHPAVQGGEHVYYLAPDRSTVTRVLNDLVRPNGLVGTPDGQTLYVADWGAGRVYRYAVGANGTLSGKALFAQVKCDGMTLDAAGNVYLTEAAVLIHDSSGKLLEQIAVPERPTNLEFGGSDRKTLFITTDAGSLYAMRMSVSGVPTPGPGR